MARRSSRPADQTTSAIEELIGARTASLYALRDLVRELEDARATVRAAQDAEQKAYAAALEGQERAVADGWTADQLRQADLYVGPSAARRRRRPASGTGAPAETGTTDRADDATVTSAPAPVTDPAAGESGTGDPGLSSGHPGGPVPAG